MGLDEGEAVDNSSGESGDDDSCHEDPQEDIEKGFAHGDIKEKGEKRACPASGTGDRDSHDEDKCKTSPAVKFFTVFLADFGIKPVDNALVFEC